MTKNTQGVIVGCLNNHEWLLPWWWINYRLHNSFPISFINFGDMSDKAIEWCNKRGEVLNLQISENFITPKEKINVELVKLWENRASPQIWTFRKAWFLKPLAMMASPYLKTIWFDLDCQVRGPIDKLFEECENPSGIAIAEDDKNSQLRDHDAGFLKEGEIGYNTGVVSFKKGAKVISDWAEAAKTENHLHIGDQQLISQIFFEKNIQPTTLQPIYNWQKGFGINYDAIVIHWVATFKGSVKTQISMMKENFFINWTI